MVKASDMDENEIVDITYYLNIYYLIIQIYIKNSKLALFSNNLFINDYNRANYISYFKI